MGYNEGVQTGFQTTGNPFSGLIKRVDEAHARRLADEKDMKELKNLFLQLGMKHEYDSTLQKEKSTQEGFLKDYEPALAGEESIPSEQFKGTPFESIAGQGKFKKKPLQEQGVFLVDPRDPQGGVKQVATVPKGSRVVQQPNSLENIATEAEVRSLGKVKPNLDRANSAIKELKTLFTKGDISKSVKKGDILSGLKERGRGVFEGIQAKSGGNPELQQYLKLRKSFASLITKGGFLEAGVLTNQDIERALGALPSTGSTKEEIELGWNSLNEVMTSAQNRFEALKSGKQSGEEKDFSEMSDEELRAMAEGR